MSRVFQAKLLMALSAFFLLSGLAGVVVGGPSAQAGWWTAVISLTFLLVAIAARRTRSADR